MTDEAFIIIALVCVALTVALYLAQAVHAVLGVMP